MDDYPRTVAQFEARFATEEACRAYLCRLRWPEGFRCRCGEANAWRTARGLWLCPTFVAGAPRGRSTAKKALVVVAVESGGPRLGRIRMRRLHDASATSLPAFSDPGLRTTGTGTTNCCATGRTTRINRRRQSKNHPYLSSAGIPAATPHSQTWAKSAFRSTRRRMFPRPNRELQAAASLRASAPTWHARCQLFQYVFELVVQRHRRFGANTRSNTTCPTSTRVTTSGAVRRACGQTRRFTAEHAEIAENAYGSVAVPSSDDIGQKAGSRNAHQVSYEASPQRAE